MASTADTKPRYPLRRGRWRRVDRLRWQRRRRVAPARLAAIAVLAVMAVAAVIAVRHWRADPRAAYRDGLAAFAEGRYADARKALTAATVAEPGPAHAMLARIAVEEGEGAVADTALQRAAAAGVAADRLHALRAAALLLDDDAEGAIAEADRAPAYDAVFARRVKARAFAANGDSAGAERLLAQLADAHPDDAGVWVDLGRVRLDRGAVGAASDAAARAVAIDRGLPGALTLQGEITLSRVGPVAAADWFAAALARDSGFVPALIENAAALGEVGRTHESLAAARAAYAARPGDPRPLYLMAVLAARAGSTGVARRLIDAMGDAADDVPGALLLAGWLAARDGHDEIAIAKWGQLLGAQPHNLEVRRLLATALLRSGDAPGALDTLDGVIGRADADSATLEIAARAARLAGDDRWPILHDRAIGGVRGPPTPFVPDGTVATLGAVAAAAPGDPQKATDLIRAMLFVGEGAGALPRAQALARAWPGVSPAQVAFGDSLALTGKWNDAARVYAVAAGLRFDEPAMLRLVDAHARTGSLRDADATTTRYFRQNPESIVARRLIAHRLATAGDPRAAVTMLTDLEREAGFRDAMLLADLSIARRRTGDAAGAVTAARDAYALMPMNVAVVRAFAAALDAAGRHDAANQLAAKAAVLPSMGG